MKEIKHSKDTHKPNEIELLEERVKEMTVGWQRCQADFINYKRQVEEDKKRLIKMANSDLLLDILPVLDNFQLAARHIPAEIENNNWAIGIKQIEKQLENILESAGLQRIEGKGKFNPNFHEAIDCINCDLPEGEIVEELQSGYQFDNAVLRPAKVRVSKGKDKE